MRDRPALIRCPSSRLQRRWYSATLAQGPRRRSKPGHLTEPGRDGHSAHSLRARFVALGALAAALAALPALLRLISGEVVGDSASSEAPGDEVGLALACFRCLLGLPPRLLGLPLSPLNPLESMPLYRGDSARPKLGTSSAPSLNRKVATGYRIEVRRR